MQLQTARRFFLSIYRCKSILKARIRYNHTLILLILSQNYLTLGNFEKIIYVQVLPSIFNIYNPPQLMSLVAGETLRDILCSLHYKHKSLPNHKPYLKLFIAYLIILYYLVISSQNSKNWSKTMPKSFEKKSPVNTTHVEIELGNSKMNYSKLLELYSSDLQKKKKICLKSSLFFF